MEFGFDVIEANFPPDPAPVQQVDGKVVCDLTTYDAPTDFPSNILLRQDLQILKLFTDNLTTIPEGLGNLANLEELVLCHFESHNHANSTKLPLSLKNLKKLGSLDVRNIPLFSFPIQLTTLIHLQELHINNCHLSSMPKELEHLQSLKVLDLSSNSFITLPVPVTNLRNLVRLYVSDGVLTTLCKEIKNLVKLERLQLTNNQLSSVPDELFELVNLKKLHLNSNKITSIGDKVGELVNLEYLVLSHNKLTRLPDTVGNLKELRYLNLHENMLTRLPESITKLTKIETLLVDNNPLQVPPVHVCNQGVENISNYFHAMSNTGHIHSKRLKVVLLGESKAGKTSLVNALVKGEACEINEDDRTFGVVFYHWKPEPDVDELELLVVDCAGQRKYQMTHKLFLSEGSLFLLAVDLANYTFDSPECFHTNVAEWIALVAALIARARILIVPTHIDECHSKEEIDLKCRNILTSVMEEQQEMVDEIDKKIKYIQQKNSYCMPEDDQKKLLKEQQEMKNNLPVISLQYKGEVLDAVQHTGESMSMDVIPVSNVGQLQGMLSLRKELVRIARNRNLSPTVDTQLPESWVTVESTMKELRKGMQIPCVSVAEFQELLKEKGVDLPQTELESCLGYLRVIGELLYFRGISDLLKRVVLNPYWLGSVLKEVFRHDLDKKLTYQEAYRKLGVHEFQLRQQKQELFDSGVMTQTLLRCIWSDLIQLSDEILYELLTLFTHCGLACEMRGSSDLDHTNGKSTSCYLMPWFLSCKRPPLQGRWSVCVDKTQIQVTAGYALLQYLPCGVFERFSVRCHNHDPDDFVHWQNGLYMKFGSVLVLGGLSSRKKCSTIELAARAPADQLPILWRTLVTLLKEIQKLLQEWPCMNYATFTICPECVKLGVREPHKFTCNWFNIHPYKNSAVCKNKENGPSHTVDLKYLFPPIEVLNKPSNPPISHQDIVLPEELLDAIADKLGRKWPRLARKLSMGKKVDSIKGDNQNNTHEQAVEMLTKWKDKNGEDAKISIICENLRELELVWIAEFIENKCYYSSSR